jgi:hypothetical protein
MEHRLKRMKLRHAGFFVLAFVALWGLVGYLAQNILGQDSLRCAF